MLSQVRVVWLAFSALMVVSLSPAVAEPPSEHVTDLSGAKAGLIDTADLIEALAVPRSTRLVPSAPPTLRLPIYFEFDSAELRPDAVELVEKLGLALNAPDLEMFSFRVEGHTDNVGPASYNNQLSAQRADAVRSILIAQGVTDSRLLSAGLGETKALTTNDLEEGRRRNRRVEIINLGRRTEP